jgi:hypothetical protein
MDTAQRYGFGFRAGLGGVDFLSSCAASWSLKSRTGQALIDAAILSPETLGRHVPMPDMKQQIAGWVRQIDELRGQIEEHWSMIQKCIADGHVDDAISLLNAYFRLSETGRC